jgi:hypothetical protein
MAIALTRLGWAAGRQWLYLNVFLSKELSVILTTNDGSITKAHIKRMRFYGLFFVANIGESLATLRGKRLSRSEREKLTWFSIFIPLFDDWFDKPADAPVADLRSAVFSADQITPRNDLDKLSLQIILPKLHQLSGDSFAEAIEYAIKTQIDSRKQQIASTNYFELRSLVYKKGGAAVLLARAFLDGNQTPAQQVLHHHIGAMIQYMDDCFDVFEDHQDGIRTLTTDCSDVQSHHDDFSQEMESLSRLLQSSGYKSRDGCRWLQTFRLWSAMTEVHFGLLTQCAKETGGKLDLKRHTRKELITDMALWKNRWAWVRAYINQPTKF